MSRWDHQRTEITHALEPARSLFWSPRTGKTRATVGSIVRQIDECGVTRVLVIGPGGPLREAWTDELRAVQPPVQIILDLSQNKIEKRKELLAQYKSCPLPVVMLVNWESLARLVEDLVKWAPQTVIADEVHYAKSAGAARSRALHRLGRIARFRRALTGTPTPKDYIDLYSQYKFVAPSVFGTNKAAFIEKYVELDYFKRPKFYKRLPELRSKMLSVASVFDRKTEWKDEEPLQIRRRIVLPGKAKAMYDQLVEKTVLEIEGMNLDATHKLSRLGKLQQLTAGFLKDDEGNVHWIHDAKTDAVVEELRDLLAAGEKVVVFYHFSEEGKEIERRIRAEFGPVVGRIGGDTPLGTRGSLQKSFLTTSGLNVMVMQDSLGIGISLKSASYLIRTSYPLDYAAFVQSNERIYEPGKTLTYITLDVPNSVDDFARRICTKKEQAHNALVLGGFEAAAYGRINLEMVA